jgi:hypothetical protein
MAVAAVAVNDTHAAPSVGDRIHIRELIPNRLTQGAPTPEGAAGLRSATILLPSASGVTEYVVGPRHFR